MEMRLDEKSNLNIDHVRYTIEIVAYLTIAAYCFEEVFFPIALHCLPQVLLQTSLAHREGVASWRCAQVAKNSLSLDDIIGATAKLGLSERAFTCACPTRPTTLPQTAHLRALWAI